MYANISIIGNVGKTPEKRNAGGNDVISFSVATSKRVKNESVTTWFNCSVWGKPASVIEQYVKKGDKIFCSGEFLTREYDGKTYLEINVRDFILMGEKQSSDNSSQSAHNQAKQNAYQPQVDELDDDPSIPF